MSGQIPTYIIPLLTVAGLIIWMKLSPGFSQFMYRVAFVSAGTAIVCMIIGFVVFGNDPANSINDLKTIIHSDLQVTIVMLTICKIILAVWFGNDGLNPSEIVRIAGWSFMADVLAIMGLENIPVAGGGRFGTTFVTALTAFSTITVLVILGVFIFRGSEKTTRWVKKKNSSPHHEEVGDDNDYGDDIDGGHSSPSHSKKLGPKWVLGFLLGCALVFGGLFFYSKQTQQQGQAGVTTQIGDQIGSWLTWLEGFMPSRPMTTGQAASPSPQEEDSMAAARNAERTKRLRAAAQAGGWGASGQTEKTQRPVAPKFRSCYSGQIAGGKVRYYDSSGRAHDGFLSDVPEAYLGSCDQ